MRRPTRPEGAARRASPPRLTRCPLRRLARPALDDPALIGAHVRKIGGVEGADLDELFRQTLGAAKRPICVDELDALPAKALIRLEDRTDFDLDPRLLPDLAGERVLEPLAGREKAAKEAPLRRAETMSRQDHMAARVDPEPHHADEESRLGAIQDAALPADGKRVVQEGQGP